MLEWQVKLFKNFSVLRINVAKIMILKRKHSIKYSLGTTMLIYICQIFSQMHSTEAKYNVSMETVIF